VRTAGQRGEGNPDGEASDHFPAPDGFHGSGNPLSEHALIAQVCCGSTRVNDFFGGRLVVESGIDYSDRLMTGEDMRRLRAELGGWSQQRLASALGMSLSRIADYERGVTRGANPRPVAIPQVVELACEVLRVRHERGQL
jgi:hypothetical protein